MIRGFVEDYLDRRASTRGDLQLIDVLAVLSLALGVSVQFVKQLNEFLSAFIQISPLVLNLLVSAVWALWAIAVIRAKVFSEAPPPDPYQIVTPRPAYRFARPPRLIAKVLFPVLLTLVVVLAYRIYAISRALPNNFFGYLVTEQGGRAGLRVEVLLKDGTPLATARYETDGVGFYVVRAPRDIPRTAQLRILDPDGGCGEGTLLSLSIDHQINPHQGPTPLTPSAVVFRHTIRCPSER